MPGLWVSPNYHHQTTTENELLIATVIWGFTLGCALFTAARAFDQSRAMWKRVGNITEYSFLIWTEWFVSLTISVLAWLHIKEIIEPSFWVYFAILTFWTIQIQCICLIIVNRIALLIVTKERIVKIRWVVVCVLGCVNISVYCIWIPARLQISPLYVTINFYWDRMEKVIFLLVDAGLNLYFIYLVRSKLIANGLAKYMPLYRFNLFMVGVSVSLDVVLIGSMSIPNDFIYLQFHPLVYMLKLYIEMNIADLIAKVVRATGGGSAGGVGKSHSNSGGVGTELQTNRKRPALFQSQRDHYRLDSEDERPQDPDRRYEHNFAIHSAHTDRSNDYLPGGITKKTETTISVAHQGGGDDNGSETSTSQLKQEQAERMSERFGSPV